MYKGFGAAFAFFVLGFCCVLFLDGGKQPALAFVSFMTSMVIAVVTAIIAFGDKIK
jgi:hypothetical protein